MPVEPNHYCLSRLDGRMNISQPLVRRPNCDTSSLGPVGPGVFAILDDVMNVTIRVSPVACRECPRHPGNARSAWSHSLIPGRGSGRPASLERAWIAETIRVQGRWGVASLRSFGQVLSHGFRWVGGGDVDEAALFAGPLDEQPVLSVVGPSSISGMYRFGQARALCPGDGCCSLSLLSLFRGGYPTRFAIVVIIVLITTFRWRFCHQSTVKPPN